MRHSAQDIFACTACGGAMERVDDVPILQSLEGHAIHRCETCEHILLVLQEREPHWKAGWLSAIPDDYDAISCASRV